LLKTLPVCLLVLAAACPAAAVSLVREVRAVASQGGFDEGERLVAAYRKANGVTPDLALAVSWLGRGALGVQDYVRAQRYADEAREAALELLETRGLDDEKKLPTALGASIEVEGQVLAERGQLSEAVAFLQDELERWRGTSIRARIQKNINLLSLEGKPAPPLELGDFVGARPESLADLRGKVRLLFFWAHWCPDCKREAPALARLQDEFGDRGLVIIGPTKLYGFARRGSEAAPEQERSYIDQLRREHYGAVSGMSVPVSEENFARYGSSTTPTIVLVDRQGIVRLYHPGGMTYDELAPRVLELL